MFNDTGKRIRFAEPATPVVILGLNEVPMAGDILQVMDDLTVARSVAIQRQRQIRLDAMANLRLVSLDGSFANIQQGKIKDLNLIMKVDVMGSLGDRACPWAAQHLRSANQNHPPWHWDYHRERRQFGDCLNVVSSSASTPALTRLPGVPLSNTASTSAFTTSSTT
jgi:hypothetical protein